ncbi:unnamed protein product [Thlaspi arvense]|uniref:Uncharacterized protein n=1 Tax=Thlaspi arvense TaxID=13288 RepID=A0AAU9RLK9_THLAR|nr:unnamed protein product [Thlaspi arvense]
MRRTIISFEIPPATLGMLDTASQAKGFTDLQRMEIGLFVSVLSLAAAAIVETVRLRLARDLDLLENFAIGFV